MELYLSRVRGPADSHAMLTMTELQALLAEATEVLAIATASVRLIEALIRAQTPPLG